MTPTGRTPPDEEFRRSAAQLVLDGGRSIRDVAGELGIHHEPLHNWVEQLRRELLLDALGMALQQRKPAARIGVTSSATYTSRAATA
jgi:transposase